MAQLKVIKVVSALPTPLAANAIYFVRVGTGFDLYVTNNTGTINSYTANYQPTSANLSALAALTGAPNTAPYFTSAGAMSVYSLTVFGRSLTAAADNAAGRSVLGLGAAATFDVTAGATGQADFLLWRTNDLVKQVSVGDSTAGRVLTNGAHGIGNIVTVTTLTDLATPNPGGLYRATSSSVNMPAGWTGAALTNVRLTSAASGYFAMMPSSTAANIRAAVGYYNGTAVAWADLWTNYTLPASVFGKSMLDAADNAAGRSLLGLSNAATIVASTGAAASTIPMRDGSGTLALGVVQRDFLIGYNPTGDGYDGGRFILQKSFSSPGNNVGIDLYNNVLRFYDGVTAYGFYLDMGKSLPGVTAEIWHSGNLPKPVAAMLFAAQASSLVALTALTSHTFTIPPGRVISIVGQMPWASAAATTGARYGLRLTQPAGANGFAIGSVTAEVSIVSTAAGSGLRNGASITAGAGAVATHEVVSTGSTAGALGGTGLIQATIANTSTNVTTTVEVCFGSEVAGSAITARAGTGAMATYA